MTIEEIIYEILSGVPAIENEVGTNIFPLMAAQSKAAPFITYHIDKATPNSGKQETSSFDTYIIDIDIFSNKYNQLIALQNLVRENFEAFTYSGVGVSVDFDFVEFSEDYKSDAEYYNRTVKIIGHIFSI